MRIQPKGGVNLRLPAYETPRNQWFFMQNFDMTHDEQFTQIKGSSKYHGTSLGTTAPTAILTYYNNETGDAKVLAAINDKILLKSQGTNQFDTTLITGLTPNKVRFWVIINNQMFIAHPDGLLQYDGIKTIRLIKGGPKIKDIIFSKETNRCFAIDANIPNGIFYTDDLSTMGGVPLSWAALNVDTVPPTDGDVIEKLGFLNGRLVYFMTNSTWIEYVNGAPSNWRYEKSPTVVGWIAPKTIHQVGQEYWGLGFSIETGRGVYGFNGQTSRLLSYDIEPYMQRINESLIQESSAEYVDNLYKLSIPLDQAIQNDTTFHFDTINKNQETEFPNIYGPHTYGFQSSAVLNTRKFKGEHLMGRTYKGGSWVMKTDNVRTQNSDPLLDNGDLIPVLGLSGIYGREEIGGEMIDESWMKRFSKFFMGYPPSGSWPMKIEILRDFKNETYTTYDQYLDTEKSALSAISLGTDPLADFSFSLGLKTLNILSDAIQIKLSNLNYKTKSIFTYLDYTVRPVRRIKEVQRVHVA